jgi:predicted transcriptional regulator of viral defense system
MEWERFLDVMRSQSIIESKALKILFRDEQGIEVQLSRWQHQGRLLQLKRGIYALAEKYRKHEIFEPGIAAVLKNPSYISLEKALEIHHLIPDAVFAYTSVTTKKRPAEFVNAFGRFQYFCIQRNFFWGYQAWEKGDEKGYLAEPEKALLDLFYLRRKKVSLAYLRELRLQNWEVISLEKLMVYAAKMAVPFISEAVLLLKREIEEGKQ